MIKNPRETREEGNKILQCNKAYILINLYPTSFTWNTYTHNMKVDKNSWKEEWGHQEQEGAN